MEKQSDLRLYKDAQINLPCKKTIDELLSSFLPHSKDKAFRLNDEISINTELLFKSEKLNLSIVDPSDSVTIDKVYDLFSKFFFNGELVSKSGIIRNMHGLSKHFTKRPQYRLFAVKNSANDCDVIGARILEQIPLLDRNLSDTGKNILYAIYIAVDKKYQGCTGIAKQLYISSLIDSVIEAEKIGRTLNAIVAECYDATENLQNSVGLKRVYFKDGIYLTELNFRQPHLSFNTITGNPTEPIGKESKEHFMMGLFSKRSINKKDLENGVRSLVRQYRSNKIGIDFKSEDAFTEYQKYFDEIESSIIEQIHQSGKLITLSRKERTIYQLKYGDNSVITHKPENGLD